MSETNATQRRKDHHIDVVLDKPVVPGGPSVGLGHYTLEYDALPEVDLDAVDLSTTVYGKRLRAPIIVGAMTGGTDRTRDINRTLARAAARVGVGMALGSQRAMILDRTLTDTFAVRDAAPSLPLLIGNIGAVQLNYGVTLDQVEQVVADVGADALNWHLNPLQEAIQPEGDTDFRGLHRKLAMVMSELSVPSVVKEVGGGISEKTAKKLAGLPIAGIEVAGVGGTSWAAVESHRAPDSGPQQVVGWRLAGFGVPTAASIRICRAAIGARVLTASGGVRTGMDIAVAIAMGADVVALAKPLLEAAIVGEDAVVAALEELIFELKTLCFCTGSNNLSDLANVRVIDVRKPYPAPGLQT